MCQTEMQTVGMSDLIVVSLFTISQHWTKYNVISVY